MNLDSLFKPLITPVSFQANFKQLGWNQGRVGQLAWVLGAVVSDLAVQALSHNLAWWTILASLITLSFIQLPMRLGIALGGLYITQAWVSLGLVLGMSMAQPIIGFVWQVWCVAAGLTTILTYMRTPKTLMP